MNSKFYAYLFTAAYVAVLALSLGLARVNIRPKQRPETDIIYIELPKPEPPAPRTPPRVREAPRHERPSVVRDNTRQVSGTDRKTRTVNRRALFKMSKSGADEPQNGGNPYAREDSVDVASGTGGGLNPVGTEALDEGLQGRGLIGALPQPIYPPGNRGGKVVVRVTVNREGRVTDAVYVPKGSTTSDTALVDAALAAARKAQFTESRAFIQGGTITYIFRMH